MRVLVLVVFVSVLAGMVNSIAGGGTLLTFPALVAMGIPPIVANATSTVALVPGAVGSMLGYRRELAGARHWAIGFAVPSLLGGVTGALLLMRTPPDRFEAIVPWLVLGATGLFIAQGPVLKALRGQPVPAAVDAGGDVVLTNRWPRPALLVFQFLVGIYGGYFGAGVGILMLAALGIMGLTNIHRMNGLKNWGGFCMNLVAAGAFAMSSLVDWRVAIGMAVGALGGGYLGSRMAQRVGQRAVRIAIVIVGLASGLWMLA